MRHYAKCCADRSNRCQDIVIFGFFKDGGCRHLGFSKFRIFKTFGAIKRVEARHRAKFRRNRSNRGRDMTIFRFSKMAAVRHLEFVMRMLGPPTKGIWWSLSLCKIWLESMQ